MGKNEKLIHTETFTSGDDFSSKQYYGCKFEDDRTIALTSADTDIPAGLIINNPEDGEDAEVLIIGRSPAVVAEAIEAGELVRIASGGKVALCEAGSDTTAYIVGQCIEGADADGEYGVFDFNFASPARAA